MELTLSSSPVLEEPSPFAASRAANVEMRRVTLREEWDQVRSLRYLALRSRGDIPERRDARFGDEHDEVPNAMTFLLTEGVRPVGTTRSSVGRSSEPGSLPAGAAFGREIEAAVGSEATAVEASLSFVDAEFAGDPRAALVHLFKAQILVCALEGADWLLAAVAESRIGFYRRVFDMEILSGPEICPGRLAPSVLMGMNVRRHLAMLVRRMPDIAVTDADHAAFVATGRILLAR